MADFSRGSSLQEWQGEYESGDVDVDCDFKKPTPKNAMEKTYLLITNQTTVVVHYYWINHDGNSNWRFGSIHARESTRLRSPLGYRFRVEGESGKSVVLEIKKTTGTPTSKTPSAVLLCGGSRTLSQRLLWRTPRKTTLSRSQITRLSFESTTCGLAGTGLRIRFPITALKMIHLRLPARRQMVVMPSQYRRDQARNIP